MANVFVTNNSDKSFDGLHAYQRYEFPVGKTVEVDEEVARYFFGYGLEDKLPILARNGWTQTMNDIPKGMEILAKFHVSTEPQAKNHSLSPVVERVPLPSVRVVGGKSAPKAA